MYLRKYLSLLLFLFSTTIAFSQTVVEYVAKNSFTGQNYQSYLFINNLNSIFIDVFHKNYIGYEELLNDNDFINNRRYVSSLKFSIDENIFMVQMLLVSIFICIMTNLRFLGILPMKVIKF